MECIAHNISRIQTAAPQVLIVYPVVLEFLNFTFLSCRYILLLLVLFAIPGVMMIVAYGLISRELYRGIQFEMGHKKDSSGEAKHATSLSKFSKFS